MKKITLVLCTTLASLCVIAQNDSSRLDAGGIVLKRNFTHHVSIRGEDLEKMPFSNLSDAINVWLNGAYTVSRNLVFVVDGNIINDVNAYSIHDIEEVVLLQNAAVLSGTAGGQQQMVLITTRRSSAAGWHIRGAAQTMLVHSRDATTNLYHQYYAGVDKGFDKFSVGLSVNYLRDVLPMRKQEGAIPTPLHMDRWRLNGNFHWTPDSKNAVELHVGFAPQTLDSTFNYHAPANAGSIFTDGFTHSHENDQQFSSWIRWRGEWLPGLRNDLQVGYLHFSQKEGNNMLYHFAPPNESSNTYQKGNGDFHIYQFYVRDRLSYAIHAQNLTLEPAINASYQDAEEVYREAYYRETGPEAGTPAGAIYGEPGSAMLNPGRIKLYVLTPTIDVSYKQVLNIQAGVVSNVSHRAPAHAAIMLPRTSAFGSVAVDLLKLDGVSRSNSLQLFASASRRSLYSFSDNSLNDVDGNDLPYRYYYPGSLFTVGNIFPERSYYAMPAVDKAPKYWVWEAGLSWKSMHGRLQLDYNFERRNFSRGVLTNQGDTTVIYWLNTMSSSQHRLGVNYRLIDRAGVSWMMGANTTVLRVHNVAEPNPYIIGDNTPDNKRPSFTGGWMNRIQCHGFSLGLDLLYHFSGEMYDFSGQNSYVLAARRNGWILQNVYAGYKVPMHKKMNLEIYADCRALAGGGILSSVDMTSDRRYYGVGANISL